MYIRARVALNQRSVESAKKCANELILCGFSVIDEGKRGVTFEGLPSLFESVFLVEVETTEQGNFFLSDPMIPETFSAYADSVYFPTSPQFFEDVKPAGD